MPFAYTPVATRHPSITMPSGGDTRTAASVGLPMSELADLILFGWAGGDTITPPSLSNGGQSNNYSPTNWSWSTLVRASSSGIHSIGGLDASAAIKRKTIANVGSNDIYLLHLASGQTAGNQIITPSQGTHVLGPRDTAILEFDPTSNAWRITGGVQHSAAHAWIGVHSWGSTLQIAGGSLTGTGNVDLSGYIEGARFIIDHADNEWDYKTPRSRTVMVPFNFVPDDASDSDIVWTAHSSSGAASLNAGKSRVFLSLPTGATLTGVFAGVTPGAGTVTLSAQHQGFNVLTGDISVAAIGSADASSGAAYQLLGVGAVSVPINNTSNRYSLSLEASAALQSCAALWVSFNDPGPRSF